MSSDETVLTFGSKDDSLDINSGSVNRLCMTSSDLEIESWTRRTFIVIRHCVEVYTQPGEFSCRKKIIDTISTSKVSNIN